MKQLEGILLRFTLPVGAFFSLAYWIEEIRWSAGEYVPVWPMPLGLFLCFCFGAGIGLWLGILVLPESVLKHDRNPEVQEELVGTRERLIVRSVAVGFLAAYIVVSQAEFGRLTSGHSGNEHDSTLACQAGPHAPFSRAVDVDFDQPRKVIVVVEVMLLEPVQRDYPIRIMTPSHLPG